ncbi:MAG: transcriptional repressor LexA [Heliobacteriaceae bacterium]|nr:transcriptional repressor LexA [Heliobacteriaceae bacterium]MDD4588199.1 transcriptional repressor LexA [Heliobacteriaceae bacterium]
MKLTPKEQAVLNLIKQNIQERGFPPSVREIGRNMNWASTSTVHVYLKRLEKKGIIRKDALKPRAITVLGKKRPGLVEVPLVGTVAAGSPILALENIEDTLSLPASLVGEGELFGLRVKGDSMIEAGILDGDTVIVRQQQEAQNGQIIVALLGDEATVKRFYRENGHIRLQPANSSLEPIIVPDLNILGKVVAVVRRI